MQVEEAIVLYDIIATTSEGGIISPSSAKVEKGETKTFKIIPEVEYEIEDVLVCGNGCRCLIYVDDTYLESSLIKALNTAIAEPCHLDVIVSSRYKPTNDTIREENELIRLMEQPKLDFKVVSKSILQGASVRFDCCDYDDGEISDLLKEEISEMSEINSLDYTHMKEYIKQVIIAPDGEIATVFINNAKITTNGGTENAS